MNYCMKYPDEEVFNAPLSLSLSPHYYLPVPATDVTSDTTPIENKSLNNGLLRPPPDLREVDCLPCIKIVKVCKIQDNSRSTTVIRVVAVNLDLLRHEKHFSPSGVAVEESTVNVQRVFELVVVP